MPGEYNQHRYCTFDLNWQPGPWKPAAQLRRAAGWQGGSGGGSMAMAVAAARQREDNDRRHDDGDVNFYHKWVLRHS